MYARAYVGLPGAEALANFLVKTIHNFADLTLVTSPQLKQQLEAIGVRRVDIWQKGINREVIYL
jgi:sulfoquinovosyltransferase